MRRSRRLLWALLLVSCLAVGAASCRDQVHEPDSTSREARLPASPAIGRVTFVQITDPHLFDAGENLHGEGVDAEALDNRAAFHWAVLTTNRLQLVEKRPIDFVVITGDFGLWNVTLPERNGQPPKKCDCPKRFQGQEGPISAVSLHDAAVEVSKDLDALVVRNIFLVPGNNDLCDENPQDLHRWAEFIFELNQVLRQRETQRTLELNENRTTTNAGHSVREAPHVVDLTYSLERLYAEGNPRIIALYPTGRGPGPVPETIPTFSGISLLGLNSAYFKPHPRSSAGSSILQKTSDNAAEKELEFVHSRIANGGSYLMFTHVPDVEDPYRGSGANIRKQTGRKFIAPLGGPHSPYDSAQTLESDPGSSWKLTPRARAIWQENILKRPEVMAVFAGHFHTSNRDLYPHNFTGLRTQPEEIVASKLWIAPPLAAKHQEQIRPAKTARGLLLANVTTEGEVHVSSKIDAFVESEPVWFETLDQDAPVEGDDKLTEAHALELDHDWDGAAMQYKAAITATDPRVRERAEEGFERARALTRTWWWKLGKWFPPVRWWRLYPLATSLGLLIVLLTLWSPKLLRGVGVLGLLARLIKWLFMPQFRGRAHVIAPVSLTDKSPTSLFAAQLPLSAMEVRRRWERAGLSFLSSGTTLLSLPSAIADEMVKEFPEVYKIDLGKYLAFLITASRYFTWRVESQLAYCPNPDTTHNSEGPGRMFTFASVRWGWFTQSSFRVSPRAAGPLDSEKAAYAVSARVLAAPWSKR
jgi:hypothetical protein